MSARDGRRRSCCDDRGGAELVALSLVDGGGFMTRYQAAWCARRTVLAAAQPVNRGHVQTIGRGPVAPVVVAGRLAAANGAVQSAATEAARAASISRTAPDAQAAAQAAVAITLGSSDLECTTAASTIDSYRSRQ